MAFREMFDSPVFEKHDAGGRVGIDTLPKTAFV